MLQLDCHDRETTSYTAMSVIPDTVHRQTVHEHWHQKYHTTTGSHMDSLSMHHLHNGAMAQASNCWRGCYKRQTDHIGLFHWHCLQVLAVTALHRT